jgi:polyhydroxybutyrate depolymerase
MASKTIMRRLLIFVFVVTAVISVAPNVAAQSRNASLQEMSVQVGNLSREFIVHVPTGLPKDAAIPVLFVFHGGGGEARGTMRLTKFNLIADREKFIAVYPQGIGKGWNDGRITQVSQAHRESVDDLAFFDAMLEKLVTMHRLDSKRIYATGISNGGIFSHYLAANRADKIAAIAPVVGGIAVPFDRQFKPSQPVSVLVIQGTDDKLVPYGGGRINGGDGKDRGSVISTVETLKRWREANGINAEPVTTTLPDRDPNDGCRVVATMWSGGRGDSVVWLYRVDGGGHTWPGGSQYMPVRVIGRVTNDIDSETIWAFFKQHPKVR